MPETVAGTPETAAPDALVWDPLAAPVPAGTRPVDAVLVLAGARSGPDLAANTALARAGIAAARDLGAARVFLASSAAVYGAGAGEGRGCGAPFAETDPPAPVSAYGRAKLAMERAAAAAEGAAVTSLRIGNVAGADALLGGAGAGPVTLDRFADGRGPRRAYVGPGGLAHALARLIRAAAAGAALPATLNLARPGTVAMADLLKAAGLDWRWRPAPAEAIPEVALDTRRLARLVPDLAPAEPAELVAEWRRWGGGP